MEFDELLAIQPLEANGYILPISNENYDLKCSFRQLNSAFKS